MEAELPDASIARGKYRLSLAYLTVPDVSPVGSVEVAAAAGFDCVGLRLLPAIPGEIVYPLISDRRLRNEVRAALSDTGVRIGDLELIRLGADSSPDDFLPFFECAQSLDARNVTVIGDDPDEGRLTANFAALCERAAPYGLNMNLEAIPWTALDRVESAARVVDNARQANAGILLDAFHFSRAGADFKVFERIDPLRMHVFQICDAPLQFDAEPAAIRCEARTRRLLPGDGELPLKKLLGHVPASALISVEVPNDQLISQFSPLSRAKQAKSATSRFLASRDAHTDAAKHLPGQP
jgi:sugar phosphate isomerase/epimerase